MKTEQHMTQEQALEAFKALFPEDAEYLRVEREHSIGCKHGNMNTFYLFSHAGRGCSIVASSNRSWEHALAIAKSGNEDCWPEDDSPFTEEAQ